MPIDFRYSKNRFQAELQAEIGARHLSDQLQVEILGELQDVLSNKIHEIVELLNKQGHSLRLYYPPETGDISYRDDRLRGGKYECDLRLGVDVVISVGFRDTVSAESEPAEE